MKRSSLKFKLLRSLMIPLLLCIVVVGGFTYYVTVAQIERVYDANLITAANVLYFLVERELEENDKDMVDMDISDKNLNEDEKEIFNKHADWREFRIWHDGKLAMFSDNALPKTISAFPAGFVSTRLEGHTWRIYTLEVPTTHITIEIAERRRARRFLVQSIIANLLWPFLLSLPFAIWLFSRALEYGLNDVRRLSLQINTLTPELMSPLSTETIPTDLIPLVEAINSLLIKLSRSLERERYLTDHAAHELKTPLAVLKLQAQLAERSTDETARKNALSALLQGVDRTSHIVDQLLILARIKSEYYPLETLPLLETSKTLLTPLRPLLDERGMKLVFKGEKALAVSTNTQLLDMFLGNIAINAIKYAPENSSIEIEALQSGDAIMLAVTDQGPGIPITERERVFDRFYRIEGSEGSGSGLGLAIAKECADQMHATIKLTSREGKGLRVILAFQKPLKNT